MQDDQHDLFQDDVARGVRLTAIAVASAVVVALTVIGVGQTFIERPTTAPQGQSSASLVAVSAR
ncbi:MAG: hypothetical protein EON91_08820 [Brevundimonas sp.]|uniref:hypothetical protein n=1 Tax=Brevundimonas sp. TaxID=1871086 RepID=UPI0012143657|nr:hypothetical protein [Brevundimonas sp.]RZJ17599.1 MAG: hypothetical protein EON91_08820 [Brevundimonas sp.]